MDKESKSKIYEYDFGVSFSGNERTAVEEVVKILKSNNYKVFYDNDKHAEFIGKDLYRYLRDIYHYKCRYVVCFISYGYANTMWPSLEMTAVKERLMETLFNNDFLLPIKMDDTKFKDIPIFIGFHEFKNPVETAQTLIDKFKSSLNEDIYAENAANFLKYLKYELINLFLKENYVIINEEGADKTSLYRDGKTISFYITNDKTLYVPCVKIYINKEVNIESAIPDILLTWNRKEGLKFKLYVLNLGHSDIKDNIILSDIINELFGIISHWS